MVAYEMSFVAKYSFYHIFKRIKYKKKFNNVLNNLYILLCYLLFHIFEQNLGSFFFFCKLCNR